MERENIVRYMFLEKEIGLLANKKLFYHYEFYQQSFYTSVVCDGVSLSSQAIKVEKGVIDLYEVLDAIESHIALLRSKLKYWCSFVKSLSILEQKYLCDKYIDNKILYNEKVDNIALDEIKEIEIAVNYRHGYAKALVNKHNLRDGDFLGNLNRIMGVIGG